MTELEAIAVAVPLRIVAYAAHVHTCTPSYRHCCEWDRAVNERTNVWTAVSMSCMLSSTKLIHSASKRASEQAQVKLLLLFYVCVREETTC